MAYTGGGLVRDVKNKAVLCKPLTLTKATYCKPHMQSKQLQTGKHIAGIRKVLELKFTVINAQPIQRES